jgi:outer membrane protein assembly factor BamB
MGNLPAMSEPMQPERRPWLLRSRLRRWLLGGLGVAVVVIAAAVIFVLVHKPHNVSHPNISFTATTNSTVSPGKRQSAQASNNFSWPLYGDNQARTRAFAGQSNLHPPFRQGWALGGNQLLEFPPVIFGHSLFFMDDSAMVKAVDSINGKIRWQRQVGKLSSASPGLAIKQRILVVPTLSDTGSTPGDGQIIALSMTTGKILWRHPLPSGAEGSPLIHGNTVFYGDQDGAFVSANVRTGHVNWTFQASGAIKGGAAMAGNDLYIDDYGGDVYDIDARNGHKLWESSADGGELGFSSGNFYSTPAVAFGRVYVGNTSGYIYSFAAGSGQLAWSYGTGNYVYSSAAVADVPGIGPTVYMGSYNGDFYAFNARSGAVRWVHRDRHDDRISGSATVVDGVVYYSDLDDKSTTGLDARTGKVVFNFADGAFSPVVADASHLYVSGGYTLYELLPKDGLTPAAGTQSAALKRRTSAAAAAKRRAAARAAGSRRAAERRAAERRLARVRAARTRAEQKRAARRRAAAKHHRHKKA